MKGRLYTGTLEKECLTRVGKNRIYVDFDHTLIKGDSLFWFLLWYRRYRLLCDAVIYLYRTVICKSEITSKEVLFKICIGNANVDVLKDRIPKFVLKYLMPLVREEMLEILFYYKRLGFSIHVVSASPSLWVDEISSQLNLDQAVSTILEDVNGVYTGVFIGSNCAGSEKVERIKRLFDKHTGDIWIGFGNLPDDSELLRICDEGFVVKKRRQFIMKRLT